MTALETGARTEVRSERLNLFLTKGDRQALRLIAQREDRDAGYVASWLVHWGIEQYESLHVSLVEMKAIHLYSELDVTEKARIRLELRREAQKANERGHHQKRHA